MNSNYLKIYLHDNSDCFRIQLIGRLQADDVAEVASCWRTSRSSVNGHSLVLDVSKLETADEAGREWLTEMREAGAQFRDGEKLGAEVPVRLHDEAEPALNAPAKGKVCRRLRDRFGISLKNVFNPTN